MIDLQCQSSLTTGSPSSVWEFKHYRRVTSKRGHETKKTCSNRVPDMTCSAAEHLKLTAVKANCRAKGKLFICFWCVSVIFHFSQLSGIFLAQKQHTWLQKLFLTSKNCKEDLVERKQIKSTTATYSILRMFGGKTCYVCTQLEHVFSSRVHA